MIPRHIAKPNIILFTLLFIFSLHAFFTTIKAYIYSYRFAYEMIYLLCSCSFYIIIKQTDTLFYKPSPFIMFLPALGLLFLVTLTDAVTKNPSGEIYSLCFYGLLCILIYSLLFWYGKIKSMAEEKMLVEQKFILQSQNYTDAVNAYTESRKILHDTNKHITLIHEMAQNNNCQGIQNYTEELMSDLSHTSSIAYTGNIAIDALCNRYLSLAKERGTTVTISTDFIVNISYISQKDICIIVGNMLENAVNAITETPNPSEQFIKVDIRSKDSLFQIKVTNSFSNSNVIGNKHNGYGIKNIEAVTKKYHGISDFKKTENIFTSTVIIPMKEGNVS